MDGEQIHPLTIEKIASGGAGLGRLDGRVVFVPYTLPGERVDVVIRERRKDYAHARAVRIAEPSPKRKQPECPLFTVCGGCDFQHMEYEDQVDVKKDLFREAFRRIGGVDLGATNVPFERSAPLGYRNRVQAHRAAGEGWGYKEAAGGRVVPVTGCPVAAAEINAFFAGRGRPAPPDGRERITLFGLNGRLFVRDDEEIRVELLGKALTFSTACFFQSNLPMLEKLLELAFEGLAGDLALDLYGGVGTFGLFLADRFRRVVSVEENPVAAAFAGRNLPAGGAEIYSGSVEKWLGAGGAAGGGKAREAPDLVVVDPPRAGLSPPVREYFRKTAPPVVLYISCDAGTLARDSRFLLDRGYLLEDFRVFDFYPQTAHLESLCRFVRRA